MNSYFEVLDDNGNVISIVRKNSHGIIEVHKLDTGITSFIKQGIIVCKKDKDMKIIYPLGPSAPVATQEELSKHLKGLKNSSSSSIY
jgi:hypothetical protein